MCVRVRRRAEKSGDKKRAGERARRTEGGTEREGKKRRVTDFESAWTSLARVRGCRHGGRGRKGGGERERRALVRGKGQERERECMYLRARVRTCVRARARACMCVRWEVSSERRGRGKKKRSRYTGGTFGGEGINACQRRGREKDGAGGGGGRTKGERAREGGREESMKRVYGRRINRQERRYRRRIVRLLGQVVRILVVTHATDCSTRALTRFPLGVGTYHTHTHIHRQFYNTPACSLALTRAHAYTRHTYAPSTRIHSCARANAARNEIRTRPPRVPRASPSPPPRARAVTLAVTHSMRPSHRQPRFHSRTPAIRDGGTDE